MKKIIILTLIIITSLSCFSQINQYDTPSRATYTPLTMEQIQAPARMMRQRYDNNAAKVNALIDWTFELKKNKADNEFLRQIENYYKELKSYYDNNLDLARMDIQIKQVELGIKEAIFSYNKRIDNQSSGKYSSNGNAGQYMYQTTFADVPIVFRLRNMPYLDSKEIYNCPKNAIIYVIDTNDNIFYKVSVNGYIGYISKNLLR